jgi:hypothetical protein
MALIERAVSSVIDTEIETMSRVAGRPTLPTTHGRRKYIITPRIVSRLGVKTPLKVPN